MIAIINHFDLFIEPNSSAGGAEKMFAKITDFHRKAKLIMTEALLNDLLCYVADQCLPVALDIRENWTVSETVFRLERMAELLFGDFNAEDGRQPTSRDALEYLRSTTRLMSTTTRDDGDSR